MKLTIQNKFEPIKVYAKDIYEPLDQAFIGREVYINDEPVPPGLAEIILLGIDTMTAERLTEIFESMKKGKT